MNCPKKNIQKFKGISRRDNHPYAQFFKGAFSYADMTNTSAMPFVSGMNDFNPFQISTPIIAGKPFFEYAKHYFDILEDIQNNDKYSGYFVNDNDIVKTLDLRKYKNGVGNRITRLLFDTAILLYVDRFCPKPPLKKDLELLDQFILFAFIWAYSLRAQYVNLGWLTAQNYVLGLNDKIINSQNIYKIIVAADSPTSLLSDLSDTITSLPLNNICANQDDIDKCENGVFQNYLYYFKKSKFMGI